jgi:hypothetical protein
MFLNFRWRENLACSPTGSTGVNGKYGRYSIRVIASALPIPDRKVGASRKKKPSRTGLVITRIDAKGSGDSCMFLCSIIFSGGRFLAILKLATLTSSCL